jgi:hypothetical protein
MKVELKIPKGWRRLPVGSKIKFGRDRHAVLDTDARWYVTEDGPGVVEDDIFVCIRKITKRK